MTVNKKVGSTIDFYNMQFYNAGTINQYNTYKTLFLKSGSYWAGTSVNEIIQRGIPSNKIVVGKPVDKTDASSGLADSNDLGKWTGQFYSEHNWYGGVMYWDYFHDQNGTSIKNAAGYLKEQCVIKRDYK